MHLLNVLVTLFSLISLSFAAPAGKYNPKSVKDMVMFLEDQANAGKIDLSRVLVMMGEDTPDDAMALMRQAFDIKARFPDYKVPEDLIGSDDYLSMVKSRYVNGGVPRADLQETFYKALGVVVKGFTILGADKPYAGTPFVDWMMPNTMARLSRGDNIEVLALSRGTSDLKQRRNVSLRKAACRRDGSCGATQNTVDLSDFTDTVEQKVKALPKQTVTLADGSTMDDPTWPDDEVKAVGEVADGYMTQAQSLSKTDPNKPSTAPTTSDPTTDPTTNSNDPTEPASPDAPTEPTDPNDPTEPADPNAPTDPNDPTKPTKPQPKGTPARPPRAARRSLRFVA